MAVEVHARSSRQGSWAQFSREYEHKVFSATAFSEHRQRIASEVKAGRVVDLGCGPTGRMIAHVAGMPGVFPTGLDFCAEIIEESRRQTAGLPVAYVQGDLECLPFAAATIDTAIAINSFLPETRAVADTMFLEATRILRPGGRLIALLPSFEMSLVARDSWEMDVLIDPDQHREWDTLGWQCFYSVEDIEQIVAKSDLRHARIERVEFSTLPEVIHITEVYSNHLGGVSIDKLTEFPLFEHLLMAER